MGHYAQRLKKKLTSQSANLTTKAPKRRPGVPLPGGVMDVKTMIQQGFDPIHAAYAFTQQLAAYFAEGVSHLPEMKTWTRTVERAEDEYMPSGPPMSPLTGSYFWMWALYDLRIGKTTDTMALCQIAANDVIQMNAHQLDACRKLADSRMGIYEHVGTEGPYVRLRELLTDDLLICHSAAGYTGRMGELWYVRLAPPLEPELAVYWVTMTTPYILIQTSKADWVDFLQRTMIHIDGPNERSRLHSLLKYGPETNYWNEFVLKAYHHHRPDAIFLAGIPDLNASLPHA
jgi:hypothetical protein